MTFQSIKSAAATVANTVASVTITVGTIAVGVAAGGLLLAKISKKD